MCPPTYQPWVNLLTLLPGTSLTLLTIAVAFLRFYNEEDFRFLGYLAQPRIWSNRLTVAALLVAVVNFGVEWNLRNCLKTRFANERQIAWLKQSNEEARRQHELRMSELRKSTEELRKSNEEARRQHEQRMSELRKENERLAELELKLDAVLPKSVSN